MGVLDRMQRADAIVLAAPQYFRGPPAAFHAMIERMQSMAFFYEAAGHSPEGSPLLGVPCGHGTLETDEVFRPFERCRELAASLVSAVRSRTS